MSADKYRYTISDKHVDKHDVFYHAVQLFSQFLYKVKVKLQYKYIMYSTDTANGLTTYAIIGSYSGEQKLGPSVGSAGIPRL